MVESPLRTALAPLALLILAGGAYFLVLSGGAALPQGAGISLTAIAGLTAVIAAICRAKIPALTAGMATLGFGLGATMSGFVVTVAAVLVIIGGLRFLISTLHLVGKRTHGSRPA